jgi:glutamate synthase (ferredoxin)
VSADGRTGDGAGILLISHMIFLKVCDFEIQKQRICCWNGFFTKKENQVKFCMDTFESAVQINLNIVGWRRSC